MFKVNIHNPTSDRMKRTRDFIALHFIRKSDGKFYIIGSTVGVHKGKNTIFNCLGRKGYKQIIIKSLYNV